jgi:NAD(P)-dependent dehydrogenase (short-subunit alcohol dehydrogenase family)
MDGAHAKILILGAYSLVGRCIVKGLLDESDCQVTATGRDPSKLSKLSALGNPRLSVSALDALDRAALARACGGADLVINCVGPYIMSGREIAETVIEAGRHYVDFAFEQFHFRRIQDLDQRARARGVALVTAAGEVVGISSVLATFLAGKLPGTRAITISALEGKQEDAEVGFSSIMNGALEPALGNQDFVDGRLVKVRMGSDIVVRSFREPYGTMKMLSDPSIDSLILPERLHVSTVKNYFGLGMEIPFGFFPLMRLLNPYKRRVFYRLAATAIRGIMRKNQARKEEAGVPVAQMLRVDAESEQQRMAIEMTFRSDFNCTAYLPILICRMFADGGLRATGLQPAVDLVTPERMLDRFEEYRSRGLLDWRVEGPAPI